MGKAGKIRGWIIVIQRLSVVIRAYIEWCFANTQEGYYLMVEKSGKASRRKYQLS